MNALEYAIKLETATAVAAMEKFNSRAGILIERLTKTGNAADLASRKGTNLVGVLTRLGAAAGFAALIKRGVEFNATMQDGEGAIAAIIQQFQGLNAEAAKAEAAKAMQQLIALEPKAAGTLTDLLNGFSSTAAAAASVGISVSENIDLTGRFANALARLKLPVDQIGQEMRSILTGNIGQDSQLARTLGITNEMVDAAKNAGKMYEMIRDKIGGMGGAADNVATKFSSLQSAVDKALGAFTEGVFNQAVGEMGDLTEKVNGVTEVMRSLGSAVALVGGLLIDTLKFVNSLAEKAGVTAAMMADMYNNGATYAEAQAHAEDALTQSINDRIAAQTEAAAAAGAATANKISSGSYEPQSPVSKNNSGKKYYDELVKKQEELNDLKSKAEADEMSTAEKVVALRDELAKAAAAEAAARSDFGPNPMAILDTERKRIELQRELGQLQKKQAQEAEEAARRSQDKAEQSRKRATELAQSRNDTMGEIALLRAQVNGQNAKADAIERAMRIQRDYLALIRQGASEEMAAKLAREKANLEDRRDGKASHIGGVTAKHMMGEPTGPLSKGGPLTKGGGLDGFDRLQMKQETDTKSPALPGYRRGQLVPVDRGGLSTRGAIPVGPSFNRALGSAQSKSTENDRASTDPNLTMLGKIHSELTRIRTA